MAETVALSLISHTNAGKTALARTLLGRDVGDVRDAPHVTAAAERHAMIETAQGDILYLWDTPGFGDSARLARRLAALDKPIVRFLAMAWDRWRDRAFWSSQQAVRNVRDEADVVLYLVNASESPADAGYLAPELRILEWIGKPAIVLLNQTGPPRAAGEEAAEIARWREALGARSHIESVLSLDAFARCWLQESVLLREVAHALPEAKQPAFARLAAAWHVEREAQFDSAMAAVATPIARAACDRVALANAGLRGRNDVGTHSADAAAPAAGEHAGAVARRRVWLEVGKAIGLAGNRIGRAKRIAMRTLSQRLDADIRASTDRLIAIHHLDGHAANEVMARLAQDVTTDSPVDERKAAVIGGFVSGALTGLAADLASGGLTFGAGLLAGGVVGAAGAAGLARGFNLVRGKSEPVVRWSDEFVTALAPAAVLRYLAVAHYGRGRGEWAASEYPPFWRDAVAGAIARQGGIAPIVARRGVDDCDVEALGNALQPKLAAIALDVLQTLYPAVDVDGLPARSRSAENATPAG